MGQHKALLTVNNRTFYDIIKRAYTSSNIVDQVSVINPMLSTLVSGDFVINHDLDKGRIYSLQLGLQQLNSDWYFIHNVDNPFINSSLINSFIKLKKEKNIIQPVYNGKKGHPILISNKVKEVLLSETNYDITLREFFKQFSKQKMETKDKFILTNINTPSEYKIFCVENSK